MSKKSPKINFTELEKDIDSLCSKILSTADSFPKTVQDEIVDIFEKWSAEDKKLTNDEYSSLVLKINSRIFDYISEYNEKSASYLFSFNSNNGFSTWATSYILMHPFLPEIFKYLLSSINDACDQYIYILKNFIVLDQMKSLNL